MNPLIDNFYQSKSDAAKSCLLALRDLILSKDESITEAWKYGMPFFCYKKKMFCYLWTDKKTSQPYLGIVEGSKINHPNLVQEKRARMKIMRFDADDDLPITAINGLLKKVLKLYR